MWLLEKLIGKPIASFESEGQKIGVWTGLPILGLDGLSSAAYGPEAALAILIPLGGVGLNYIGPIMLIIIAVLTLVYLSYRQTIRAYPNGGGSYTVAKQNLGNNAGLLAAAALMLDYILNVSVGISAGIGALISAIPALHPHTLSLCLTALVLITVINLRGVRDTGFFFAAPTYLFIVTLLTIIAIGIVKIVISGGFPEPIIKPPPLPAKGMELVSLWLLLRCFASGCTAMTGVEAVSNAVGAFKTPAIKNATRTLTAIVTILVILLGTIAYLVDAYHIGAMDQSKVGYQTILSQLVAAVVGRGFFYYLTLFSIIFVLILSANTSFADFPRLAHMLAQDNYFPRVFATRGRRLVYTMGILLLAIIAGILLIVFDGITDALIPLFAIGAFLAFTMSQTGMVVHWRRKGAKGNITSLIINMTGAIATAIALVILLLAKFTEGAWITVLLIPSLLILVKAIKQHYTYVAKKTAYRRVINVAEIKTPLAVLPIDRWSILSENGLRFALQLSSDVIAVHINIDEEKLTGFKKCWQQYVIEPLEKNKLPKPQLVILSSPYRLYEKPLLEFILQLEKENPNRTIAVIVPELVQSKWYQYLLHNQRAADLKDILLHEGDRRIVMVSMPWYLNP